MKFKLIKKFPNSLEVGEIVKERIPYVYQDSEGNDWFNCHAYPEFWQEVKEQDPFVLNKLGNVVIGVTRVSDGVYFSPGMRIKMPNYGEVGFIYNIKYENEKLIIDHTFSFLMNEAGYKDQLKYLRPCLYTKEDLNNYEKIQA